jgi:hypothetical protein
VLSTALVDLPSPFSVQFQSFPDFQPYSACAIHMGIDLVAAASAVALIAASSVLGKVVSPTLVERSLLARWERGLALCAFDAVFFSFSKNRSPPSECFICLSSFAVISREAGFPWW